jgi:hypothetical protein
MPNKGYRLGAGLQTKMTTEEHNKPYVEDNPSQPPSQRQSVNPSAKPVTATLTQLFFFY